MINEKQKAERKSGIFSSDVPRIMQGDGVRVALEKMGEVEPVNLDAIPEIQLGNLIEPRILDAYEAAHGAMLKRSPDTMRHPDYPWLGAHLDGFTMNEVIEAKSVGRYNRHEWGDPGTDEVPDRVLWQVQEQLAVTKLQIAKVPVCFLTETALVAFATGNPLPIDVYVVPASAELAAYIVERCGKIWQHIEAKTLPEPETPFDARLIYQKDSGAVIDADEATMRLYVELMSARAAKSETEEREKLLVAQIQSFMKDAAELRWQGQTLATWRLTAGRKGYTVPDGQPYRVFRAKEVK